MPRRDRTQGLVPRNGTNSLPHTNFQLATAARDRLRRRETSVLHLPPPPPPPPPECLAMQRYGIPYFVRSQADHSKIGSGWASVLNTQRSSGTGSSSRNNRNKYFNLEMMGAGSVYPVFPERTTRGEPLFAHGCTSVRGVCWVSDPRGRNLTYVSARK